MDEDNLKAAMDGLLKAMPKAIAASDPKAYEAMANGMLIVSTNPEELIALETSGIPEYGPEFFQRDGGGGFRWIEIAGTRFYVTYHPAQFYKYQEQKALWEFEKLFPGIFG